MTKDVVCLKLDDCLSDAIQAMQMGRFRHAPVMDDERKMMGIVSDRDVLHHLSFPEWLPSSDGERFRGRLFETDDKDPALKLPIPQIMTRNVGHVLPSCSVYEAAEKLHDMRVSCLPVVDEDGELRGIVTVTDLMTALLAVYRLTRAVRI